MKKILITGISGFAGSYLAEHLLSLSDTKIFGTYHFDQPSKNLSRIQDKIILSPVNLLHKEQIQKVIQEVQPDEVYHLAAMASPGKSFEYPAETITNNVTSQINLLEVVRQIIPSSKILIVSSADVYGNVSKEDVPIDENTPFKPTNPYAVSKVTQDLLGYQYFLSYSLPIVRVRPFNHIGPRQAPTFVVTDFAKQIAEIEKGEKEPCIKVGNLSPRRDFTDVRDIIRAYVLALEKVQAGDVYNIGSGASVSIIEILEMLLSFSTTKITIQQDESLLRPSDSEDRVCKNNKFVALTGWKPEISLEQTLKDTLEYWRTFRK